MKRKWATISHARRCPVLRDKYNTVNSVIHKNHKNTKCYRTRITSVGGRNSREMMSTNGFSLHQRLLCLNYRKRFKDKVLTKLNRSLRIFNDKAPKLAVRLKVKTFVFEPHSSRFILLECKLFVLPGSSVQHFSIFSSTPPCAPPPPTHTTSPAHHLPHAPPPTRTTSPAHHSPHVPFPLRTTSPAHHSPRALFPPRTIPPAHHSPRAPHLLRTTTPAQHSPRAPPPLRSTPPAQHSPRTPPPPRTTLPAHHLPLRTNSSACHSPSPPFPPRFTPPTRNTCKMKYSVPSY